MRLHRIVNCLFSVADNSFVLVNQLVEFPKGQPQLRDAVPPWEDDGSDLSSSKRTGSEARNGHDATSAATAAATTAAATTTAAAKQRDSDETRSNC